MYSSFYLRCECINSIKYYPLCFIYRDSRAVRRVNPKRKLTGRVTWSVRRFNIAKFEAANMFLALLVFPLPRPLPPPHRSQRQTIMLTLLIFTSILPFLSFSVRAFPLSQRDVITPPIIMPDASSVWPVGSQQTVIWYFCFSTRFVTPAHHFFGISFQGYLWHSTSFSSHKPNRPNYSWLQPK